MVFPESPAEGEVFAVGSRLYVWEAATGWRPAGASGADPDPGTLPDIYAAIATRAPKDSPVFTGPVKGVTKTHVGLPNVDDTSDADKPVSNAQRTELDKKVNSHNAEFTGTAVGLTKVMVGLSRADNTSDAEKPVSLPTQTAIAQAVAAVTKASIGLSKVQNLSPEEMPVSTAVQAAIDAIGNSQSGGGTYVEQLVKTSTVFTVPENCYGLAFEMVGGGGGGGMTNLSGRYGGAGGFGGYVRGWRAVTPGQQIYIEVGAGGAGGTKGGTSFDDPGINGQTGGWTYMDFGSTNGLPPMARGGGGGGSTPTGALNVLADGAGGGYSDLSSADIGVAGYTGITPATTMLVGKLGHLNPQSFGGSPAFGYGVGGPGRNNAPGWAGTNGIVILKYLR